MCYFIRDYHDEWLSFPGLRPQLIGLPPCAVTLLGGTIDAGESHQAATLLGNRRFNRAFMIENVGPHNPRRHLPIPEDDIKDEERALDINLVPDGVDPAELAGEPLVAYSAHLSLIAEVGTLGSPVGIRDDVLYARRALFETEERNKVEELIASARKRYAEEGKRIAKIYADARARS